MTVEQPSTREQILLQASILFARQGYHATSTRQIASAVGIRQPSLFYHFPTKTDIMRALLVEAIDGPVAAVERQLAADGSPAIRLHRYIVQDLITLCESVYNLAGTTTAAVLADPEFAAAASRYRCLFAARTRLIQEGIDAGEFFPVNAEFASRAIEWAIEGLHTEIVSGSPGTLEADVNQVADFCVRALLIDGSKIDEIRAAGPAATAG
ncbi:TetR/AcrR family transcriptional regulator [bacterium]|nr:TetR/AcrR family transcriptional regulator [bacterium]